MEPAGRARRPWQTPVLLGIVFAAGLGLGTARRHAGVAAQKAASSSRPVASTPGCGARITEALAHNRWSEADAATRGCDDPASVATVRFVQGAFSEASAQFAAARLREPARRASVTETEAHLFADERVRAAETAQQMLAQFYTGPETQEKRALRCIVGRIEGARDTGYPCVFPRTSLGYGFQSSFAPYDRAVANPFSAFVGTRGRLRGRPLAIERMLLGGVGTGRASDVAWSAELALFHAWSGASAPLEPLFRTLDIAARDVESGASFEGEDAEWMKATMSVAAAAALYRSDGGRVLRYARLGESHSAGVVLQVQRTLDPKQPWEPQIEDDHWGDHREVFDAAHGGDGVELAAALVGLHTTGADTLARVFPRLQRNQDSVRAWFDEAFPGPCLDCGLMELIGHLVERRNVARLLGREAEAKMLDPVVARLVEARLAERTAYVVDELEGFFSPP